jgi:hypothetical protein
MCSGRAAVAVMQAADLRNRDNSTAIRQLDLSLDRRVPIQREMRSRVQIVVEVGSQDAKKVSFVDNDDVVETLTAD